MKIQGLVIGTRKAGTTWLYENFRKDPRLCVSEKVKESGYFTGITALDANGYEALFAPDEASQHLLEVDTSRCYSAEAPELIGRYNPEMRLALIFREPGAFLASRYTHSLRKGEVTQDNPEDALLNNAWLMAELDYPAIMQRFSEFEGNGALEVFDYARMSVEPVAFYNDVLGALGISQSSEFSPDLERVNPSRDSRFPLASTFFSQSAKAARKLGLHGLVNTFKSTGIHSVFERQNSDDSKQTLEQEARAAVARHCPGTVEFYQQLSGLSEG